LPGKKPDLVILEVGLGGAIDSTNVVTPLLAVLTSIGMDHIDYLGNYLRRNCPGESRNY
jgi:dihydrofolate synthase/folylpolyglutamate synthase